MADEATPSTLADVSLEQLAEGAAGELFEREMQRVLGNILDPNTDWKKRREITLKFIIAANEDRESAILAVDANSKIAPARPHVQPIFLGRRNGRMVAVSRIQHALFPEDPAVTPMPARANGGG
jgi:hypothetical protein